MNALFPAATGTPPVSSTIKKNKMSESFCCFFFMKNLVNVNDEADSTPPPCRPSQGEYLNKN